MSVRLSVRMEQLGCHRTDFNGIWYLRIFFKRGKTLLIQTGTDDNMAHAHYMLDT